MKQFATSQMKDKHMAKIGRDAGTGQFIPVKVATANPKGSVVETIKRTPPKGK